MLVNDIDEAILYARKLGIHEIRISVYEPNINVSFGKVHDGKFEVVGVGDLMASGTDKTFMNAPGKIARSRKWRLALVRGRISRQRHAIA